MWLNLVKNRNFEIFVLLDCVASRGTDSFHEHNPYLFLFSTTMYNTVPNLVYHFCLTDIDVCKHHTHKKEYLGIEFYLFVLMKVWSDRGSTCKFRNARSAFRNLHVDPLSLHTFMRNKQVEFNPYIYTLTTLSKLYRFGYEISVF